MFTPATVARFWAKVDKSNLDGCWLWTASIRGNSGYGAFRVGGKTWSAHRFIATVTYGDVPARMDTCHSCAGPRTCVRPDHLYVGTRRQNMDDARRLGRLPRGERSFARRHPERLARGSAVKTAKLRAADVRRIRKLAADGLDGSEIAELFAVHKATVSRILCGKQWRHII